MISTAGLHMYKCSPCTTYPVFAMAISSSPPPPLQLGVSSPENIKFALCGRRELDETRRLLYRLNPNKYRSGVMLPRRYTSMYRCRLYQGAHPYFLCPLRFHILLLTFFPVNFGRNFEAKVFLVPIWGLMADVILSSMSMLQGYSSSPGLSLLLLPISRQKKRLWKDCRG